MKKSLLTISFAIAVLASCNNATQESNGKSVFLSISKEKTFVYNTEIGEEIHPGEPSFCSNTIYAFIPETINGEKTSALTDSIITRAFPNDTESKNIEQAVERFINNFDYSPEEVKNLSEVDSAPYSMGTTHSVNIGIASTSKNVISIKIAVADYIEGAAHGYAYNTYLNYATDEKKVLSLSDLFFIDENFMTTVKQQLITKYGAGNFEELKNNLGILIDESDFKLSSDFWIDENVITLSYRPYELACYAAGTIELEIYTYTISENLTPLGKKILM